MNIDDDIKKNLQNHYNTTVLIDHRTVPLTKHVQNKRGSRIGTSAIQSTWQDGRLVQGHSLQKLGDVYGLGYMRVIKLILKSLQQRCYKKNVIEMKHMAKHTTSVVKTAQTHTAPATTTRGRWRYCGKSKNSLTPSCSMSVKRHDNWQQWPVTLVWRLNWNAEHCIVEM